MSDLTDVKSAVDNVMHRCGQLWQVLTLYWRH